MVLDYEKWPNQKLPHGILIELKNKINIDLSN
jgi:hypothetical protein